MTIYYLHLTQGPVSLYLSRQIPDVLNVNWKSNWPTSLTSTFHAMGGEQRSFFLSFNMCPVEGSCDPDPTLQY